MPQQLPALFVALMSWRLRLTRLMVVTSTLQITDTGSMQEVVDKINDQGPA